MTKDLQFSLDVERSVVSCKPLEVITTTLVTRGNLRLSGLAFTTDEWMTLPPRVPLHLTSCPAIEAHKSLPFQRCRCLVYMKIHSEPSLNHQQHFARTYTIQKYEFCKRQWVCQTRIINATITRMWSVITIRLLLDSRRVCEINRLWLSLEVRYCWFILAGDGYTGCECR